MISLISLLGFVGDFLLIFSWIPKAVKTIKAGKTNEGLTFISIYVLASLILTIYAFLISDLVFIILNLSVTLISGINVYYKLNPRKNHLGTKAKKL